MSDDCERRSEMDVLEVYKILIGFQNLARVRIPKSDYRCSPELMVMMPENY